MAMYQTLAEDDAVRFIRLSPSEPHAPLSIELVPGTLSTVHETYEATSYTLGDDQPTTTILCNGEAFELRQNAYDCLCRLRKPDTSRLLWMDCICIDQHDPTERANQVKIMHLIYEHAKAVLVWLGPESSDSALAMEYVSQLDSQKYVLEANLYAWGGTANLDYDDKSYLFDNVSESQENQLLVTALCALVSRSWLLRMWIQQEAAVCSDTRVFCGDHDVPWEQFFSLAWLLLDRTSADWPRWIDVHPAAIQKSLSAALTIQRNRVNYLKIPSPWAVETYRRPTAYLPNHEEKLVLAEAARTGPVVYKGRELLVLLRECSGCQAKDP
ncbi:hypothetical protein LTR85_004759 [Meristemomyces frigidus]|nr:hypothetical protein LTR85_004759 [Meristemomyces frigidus]